MNEERTTQQQSTQEQATQQADRNRTAPSWARRARTLGEDLTYVLEGWAAIPKPSTRLVIGVVGCVWTAVAGPPEFIERLLALLTSSE